MATVQILLSSPLTATLPAGLHFPICGNTPINMASPVSGRVPCPALTLMFPSYPLRNGNTALRRISCGSGFGDASFYGQPSPLWHGRRAGLVCPAPLPGGRLPSVRGRSRVFLMGAGRDTEFRQGCLPPALQTGRWRVTAVSPPGCP